VTRSEFAHAVRAAGAVLEVNELLVISSQALHAAVPDALPVEALQSVEADIATLHGAGARAADLIDGTLGEGSMFHDTFGYYAHGVEESTAVLPTGWRDRLLAFTTPETKGVTAWCLEPHDLWIAKAVAGRDKDSAFCRALINRGIVSRQTLRERLLTMADLADELRVVVSTRIDS
jgi:hypothetical protein